MVSTDPDVAPGPMGRLAFFDRVAAARRRLPGGRLIAEAPAAFFRALRGLGVRHCRLFLLLFLRPERYLQRYLRSPRNDHGPWWGPYCKSFIPITFVKSGRLDLNQRPLGPEPSALARLSYAPKYLSAYPVMLFFLSAKQLQLDQCA